MPSLLRYSLPALISIVCASQVLHAQTNLWTEIRETDIQADPADRLIIPDAYQTVELDFPKMDQLLQLAPTEQEHQQGTNGLLLQFPMPDGSTVIFEIWKTTVLHPQLQAKYPEIRAYVGKSTDRPGMLARIDISPYGFHAMFLNTGKSAILLTPTPAERFRRISVFTKKITPAALQMRLYAITATRS